MIFYCTEQFKREYEKLIKKKSYRQNLPKVIIKEMFNSTIEQLNARGRKLNLGTREVDFLKIRLGGSSGYRCYYLMVLNGDKVYLGFIHPKSGTYGAPNITAAAEGDIFQDIQNAAINKDFYLVTPGENELYFSHRSDEEE